jgi:hypothetical protein
MKFGWIKGILLCSEEVSNFFRCIYWECSKKFTELCLLSKIVIRLISEKTIEENILKKANEKRLLGNVAIEGGNFTTAFFRQVGCLFE